MDELISVIMPVWKPNLEQFNLAVNSILSQSYKNWELIFYDNLSLDNSKKILLKFNDKRIKYFKSEKFRKLYDARNKALEFVTGDYICFGGGLIKIDQIGNEIWREDNVSGNSVVESIDGGYITAGSMIYSLSPPEYHIRLNKFDQQGNSLWYNIILGDSNLMNTPIQISNTDDGGYIIVGYRGSNSMDLWLIKIDADGNKLWDRTYGGGALDLGQSVQQKP